MSHRFEITRRSVHTTSMEGSFKILYAEDEPDLREITTELLIGEGYDCTPVADGIEAMKKLQEEKFDLLLTDFRMPHMDGALLLIWCRENGFHLPIIFISGNMERLPLETLALNDCCSFLLQKPVSLEDLSSAIEKARSRAHEFDCQGKIFKQGNLHEKGDFQGQHFC